MASPGATETPQSTRENAIVSDHLEKKFDDQVAVRDLTFAVPKGTIFGFVGPSGSGKTTTVRMLTGIYAPSAGHARVLGSEPRKFSRQTRMRIGYMPQLFVLYPHLTIGENLNFAASLYGMGLSRGRRINQVLDLVELRNDKDKLTREASGGMQRRLSLAATLVHDPTLLFLDEPTAGVDPVLRRKFWDHFRDLQKQGRTLFVTTQYVNEASYCDLVGVMQEGALMAVDTPVGLRHRAFGGDIVQLETEAPLDMEQILQIDYLPFVKGDVTRSGPSAVRLVVDNAATATPALVEWARNKGIPLKGIGEYVPPFDDVFVELVKPEGKNG